MNVGHLQTISISSKIGLSLYGQTQSSYIPQSHPKIKFDMIKILYQLYMPCLSPYEL